MALVATPKFDPLIFDELIFDTFGDQALMYALSGVARSGATRSNYHSPKCFVSVATVQRGDGAGGIKYDTISVTDTLNEVANTATMSVAGFVPQIGQEVIITLGSQNNRTRLFAGTILNMTQAYEGVPSNVIYHLSLIDFTWGLNKRKVNRRYQGETATAIAIDLIQSFAPGYTVRNVVPDLDVLDEFTCTNEDVTDALTRLANRIGAYWYLDYLGDLHFFLQETDQAPQALTIGNPSLRGFLYNQDVSQFVTRIFGQGGGVTAITDVASGETILPVADAIGWYSATGGLFQSGPQRCIYTGTNAGGEGSLVGPGAAPASAVAAVLAGGSGIESGAHSYAYTYVTGAGETIAGPLTAITVGTVPAPTVAPTAGVPTSGGSVTTGVHSYAVTFTSATGETTSSPVSSSVTTGPVTTGTITDPGSAPVAAAPTSGGSVTVGSHDYAITFYNGAGETIGSPTVTRNVPTFSPPSGVGNTPVWNGTTGNLVGDNSLGFLYEVTFVTSAGETTGGGGPSTIFIPVVTSSGGFSSGTPTAGGSIDAGTHFYAYTLQTATGETVNQGGGSTFITVPNQTVPLTRPSTSDARITHWNIYRSKTGTASPLYLVASVPIGTASYNDTASDASLPATQIPVVDTASTGQINLTNIPTGASGTTGRRIYRTVLGGSQKKLVATIADNTTTSYTDNVADGSLGADIPVTNTATFELTVALSSIPLGGAGTTGRKVYRTAAGGGQLKLLTTISNNSATTYNDTTADGSLGANIPVTNTTGSTVNYNTVPLSAIPLGPPATTSRKLYRTAAGGSQMKLLATLADNTTTIYSDIIADGSLGADIPVVNTATANRVNLTGISVGPSGVTSRKIYRTAAAGAQLKLLATLADKTTTVYADSTADGSLGANVPVTDLSGLSQVEGQVLAGSTSIPVAGPGAFPTAGWAIIGNGQQVIRYTGKTDSLLTGIPASGPGSITATVAYNSNITAAPQLIGIPATGTGSIIYPILKGDQVDVLTQRDDVAAQAALAALIGGDGIQEGYIQNGTLSEAEMINRCDALLAQRGRLITGIQYDSHDINTRSGYDVQVMLNDPTDVSGTFKIQQVVITGVDRNASIMPWYAVTASTERFSFEELLRRERGN